MTKVKKIRLCLSALVLVTPLAAAYVLYNIGFAKGVSKFNQEYTNNTAAYIQSENEISPGLAAKVSQSGLYFKHQTFSYLEFYDRGLSAGNNSEALKVIKRLSEQ